MIFNPITNSLYTDDNIFLKNLHCPYRISWNNLKTIDDSSDRMCELCDKKIIDTESLSDGKIKRLINTNKGTCLKIDFNQDNVRISTHA